ncbi:hypothetical protein [Spirilliplanes yamanashiensis]|uniref:Uncharacterized protein n=1 Tax=Spirilliplanes yamanashiensis TaxID=42233 RepID=A0A8J3Y5Q2_9ACTN|nr:hypothetical protein [Spirilliplanes yamanashiensis]MDP9819208.1 hypothetical protein [Spirilliplanes yamanashiensis]GIJ01969.1 hypothetical protein Sya03_13210 [Spirilliplanes yamanashiensis]
MNSVPWWALPLVAGVFALAGALVAQLVTARHVSAARAVERRRLWYDERRDAYVGLLSAYERIIARLRRDYADGVVKPDPLRYQDEIGPTLMSARLLAGNEVRNAALAVHKLVGDLHDDRPAGDFVEVLNHVPLVLHDLERAVRAELDIQPEPPALPDAPPPWRDRLRLRH